MLLAVFGLLFLSFLIVYISLIIYFCIFGDNESSELIQLHNRFTGNDAVNVKYVESAQLPSDVEECLTNYIMNLGNTSKIVGVRSVRKSFFYLPGIFLVGLFSISPIAFSAMFISTRDTSISKLESPYFLFFGVAGDIVLLFVLCYLIWFGNKCFRIRIGWVAVSNSRVYLAERNLGYLFNGPKWKISSISAEFKKCDWNPTDQSDLPDYYVTFGKLHIATYGSLSDERDEIVKWVNSKVFNINV